MRIDLHVHSNVSDGTTWRTSGSPDGVIGPPEYVAAWPSGLVQSTASISTSR